MQINFNNITYEMDNLIRLYMVFGEEPFTYEEANSVADFTPNVVKVYRDLEWVARIENDNETTIWKLSYMGARMTEIYMELKNERVDKQKKSEENLF